jgi:hypothetical protein
MSLPDEAQGGGALPPQPAEEAQQRAHLPVGPDPEQPPAPRVELVDQGHVPVAPLAGQFVDPDRRDPRQVAMRQAPLHGHRDGAEHVVPGRVKRLGPPVQLSRRAPAARNHAWVVVS